MRLIGNKLYLTIQEAVECGVASETYLWKAKSQGTKCWDLIDDPDDKRKVLVGFDMLNDYRKGLVKARYGNPYEHLVRRPILEMVVNDPAVHSYYMGYKYGEGLYLPELRVRQYTRAAAWLATLARVMRNKKAVIEEQLKLDRVPQFFEHVAVLVNLEKERGKMPGYAGIDVLPGDFPSSYKRLLDGMKRWESDGMDGLIDPMFGNKIGAKLGKVGDNSEDKRGVFDPAVLEDQMAVLRHCSANGNNLDAAQVAKIANSFFAEKGMKTVSRKTINRFINKNIHLLTAGRQGKKAHDVQVARHVKRIVTPHPLMYWTLDGWTVELIYQERINGKVEYKRLVAVIVLDVWQKYPIGYAIGERETADLIREACRNAMLHVRELFGAPYQPWQVQSDNYQLTNLTPFYQAMAHLHTPAAVGNAKAKVIEPYFKDLNKNYCQFMHNWSGFNITARKETQVNVEKLNKLKKFFPTKEQVAKQIHAIIELERRNKLQAYMEGMQSSDQYQLMTEMSWLEVFGLPLGKRTNVITGEGISKQYKGVERVYDTFDMTFRQNMNVDWMLYGDPADLKKVLAKSPDGKLKYVLEEVREIPMDVRSQNDDDRRYRAQIENMNKLLADDVSATYEMDAQRTRELLEDTPFRLAPAEELALKGMFIVNGQQKDLLQDAKGLGNGSMTEGLNGSIDKKAERLERKKVAADIEQWSQLQDNRMTEVLSTMNFE